VHSSHSPGWADFTIMMECTSKSNHCHSVYSVAQEKWMKDLKQILFVHSTGPWAGEGEGLVFS
jgi:hypothetical protein